MENPTTALPDRQSLTSHLFYMQAGVTKVEEQ